MVVVAATISDEGENVYEQAALCVTVNVAPPIVIVPVRLEVPVFAATLYVAVPFPLPVDPVTIHDVPLTADHAQPVAAVTLMLPEPAEAVNDWLDGEIEGVHVEPDASWLMVNVVPAIVSDPVRLLAEVFAVTLKDTEPAPVPVAPLVTVIQLLLLTAVQAHQSAAVTVAVPAPPAEANDWFVGEIDGAHGPSWVTLNTVPAIVSEPIRLHVVGLAATSKVTEPLPVPDAPLVTVIHALLLTAVHGQPVPIATVLLPVPPAAVNDWLDGDSEDEHEVPPWVTVNVAPATVSVPVRLAAVLAATLNETDPLPAPVAPLVTVINVLLLTAVHGQPGVAVTVVVPVPPDVVNDWLDGDVEPLHVAPAASWVMVNVAPAIVREPVRSLPELFAPTLNDTGPLPVPDAPLITVIHGALLTAVQAHQSAAVTVLLPPPPADVKDWVVGEIVGAHGPP